MTKQETRLDCLSVMASYQWRLDTMALLATYSFRQPIWQSRRQAKGRTTGSQEQMLLPLSLAEKGGPAHALVGCYRSSRTTSQVFRGRAGLLSRCQHMVAHTCRDTRLSSAWVVRIRPRPLAVNVVQLATGGSHGSQVQRGVLP